MAAAAEVKSRGEPPRPPNVPGYRIESVLGRGATGTVYRARQLSVDREVALKVLHPDLAGAGQAVRRMQREARTTARLSHPNIISAIDMGEVDGLWWYAMELVDGVSLAKRLKDGPLSEREALRIFIPLVEALQHAFERGVVHRDVKPANILLERGGRALLVDLGLAFAGDDPMLTKAGGTLGTPHYISPEQARDPSSADVQSDLWSLGATMYHAVCGRPPFSGDSVAEILSEVLYSKVPDPAQVAPHASSGFALVLRKCLTRDRAHRYAAPAELLADLERVRERRAPLVRRGTLEPVAREWRVLPRAVGFAALTVAGLAAVWLIALATNKTPKMEADAPPRSSAPDPIAHVGEAASGPSSGLLPAFAEAAALEGSAGLRAEDRLRAQDLRFRLHERIEQEIWEFQSASEADLGRKIERAELDDAQDLVDGGLRRSLVERVGSGSLPADLEAKFGTWLAGQVARVRGARQRAEQAFGTALERHVKEKVFQRSDDLVARGRWRDAHSLLGSDPRGWIADAKLSTRGLSEAAVTHGLETVRPIVDARRGALESDWKRLDEDLRSWVEGRVAALRDELAARTVQDAAGRLQSDWEKELAARRLQVDQMPYGLLHQAYEDLVGGKGSLSELEEQIAAEDARLRLEEIETDTAPMWKERRYGDIAEAFEAAAGEEWSRRVKARIELRAREAKSLEGLIARAVEGLRRNDGKIVELRQGTVAFKGKLTTGSDPLANGFRIAPAEGKERVYSLRANGPGTAAGAEAIESLAGLAPPEADPRENLLRALFRWREGDARGAQAALNSGALPREDPLVAELESEIAAALGREASPASQRRQTALKKYRLLNREMLESVSRERLKNRIEEVMQFADVLTTDEANEVRRMRDDLALGARPSTVEDFQEAFGLPREAIEFVPNSKRVALHFDFGAARTGAFDKGDWSADGVGWSATKYAKNEADMLEGAGPTLALRDPLRAGTGILDIRLRFQPAGSAPPDLLFVTVAGFNVVLTGDRCLVDTTDAKGLVARARQGKGYVLDRPRSFLGFELHLVLNRARGSAMIEVDGRKVVDNNLRVQPSGDDKSLALSIRSFEPLRLVSASIEGTRR